MAASVSLQVSELVRILREVEPAALLVPPRVLRRVIKHDRHIGGFGLSIPHRKSYIIEREPLLLIATRQELGIVAGEEIPAKVMLLERPDQQRLAPLSVEQALVKYWRMLFHARIDLAMAEKLADGRLNKQSVRERIQQLGNIEFDEIAFVMRQENFLLPPETTESIYAEFISVYWTLRLFTPQVLPTFFPCLRHHGAIDALACSEIDAKALFAATRLPGAPDPEAVPLRVTQTDGYQGQQSDSLMPEFMPTLSSKSIHRLESKAHKSDAHGNNVRAAILRTRAAYGANLTMDGARAELSQLVKRLQAALELSDVEAEKWRRALLPLLTRAARGAWSQEARFLYDLQKVCVDSERGIYALDLLGWALTLGHRPLRRPLPGHQAVAIVRHLRGAQKRMRHLYVADGPREQLSGLLERVIEEREGLLRDRFRPVLVNALGETGFLPKNVPERIARDKLIEQLLDRVVEHGHFNLGILRDAISQNQLKLEDLTPKKLVRDDELLQLNRTLANKLDGVYRKGEIYLRFFQRLSSVFFGTGLGRIVSLYFLLPVAAAFTILVVKMEVEHLFHTKMPEHEDKFEISPWQLGLLSVFFLLLFRVSPFRRLLWRIASNCSAVMRGMLVSFPLWLVKQPAMRAILDSRPVRSFQRILLRPLAYGGGAACVAYLLDPVPDAPTIIVSATAIFLLTIVLAFTRVGRWIEETTTDWAFGIWQRGFVDLISTIVVFFLDIFKAILESLEQGLYTVDEWLRFRGGQGWLSLAIKAPLALFWSWITYIFRFTIILLVEPQVNPIKHFPVVTVAHKVMIVIGPFVVSFVEELLEISHDQAIAIVASVIWLIPGIFGFAVWELKENWKLYAANRPKNLKPVLIGSHGETMVRLIRPGFHSGTVPKLYYKLRKAVLHGKKASERKAILALHHVEESVGHFVERELLALLRQSKGWNGLTIDLAGVHLATNRIVVELACPALNSKPLLLGFDHQSGWLLAEVLDTSWLAMLTPKQRQTFTAALTGLYKMAGVNLTRVQIVQTVATPPATFRIRNHNLIVWPSQNSTQEFVFDLTTSAESDRLLFDDVSLSWNEWVETWEQDKGRSSNPPLKLAYVVLP